MTTDLTPLARYRLAITPTPKGSMIAALCPHTSDGCPHLMIHAHGLNGDQSGVTVLDYAKDAMEHESDCHPEDAALTAFVAALTTAELADELAGYAPATTPQGNLWLHRTCSAAEAYDGNGRPFECVSCHGHDDAWWPLYTWDIPTPPVEPTVPVPCPIHRRHDLTIAQAARAFIVINAMAEEAAAAPDVYVPDRDQCALNADDAAKHPEGYYEHVESLMARIGITYPFGDRLVDRHQPRRTRDEQA